MKKEDLEKVFTDASLEVDEEKKKTIIAEINRLNGMDVTNAKKDYDALTEKVAEKDKELLKYQKDGELYVDTEELKTLKEYKQNAEQKNAGDIQKKELLEVLNDDKYKFDKKAINLLYLAAKENAQFDDNNKLKDAESLMSNMTETYKDYVVTEVETGAKPTITNDNKNLKNEPANFADAVQEHYKEN